MLTLSAVLFASSLLALGAAFLKAHQNRRDEGRMTGYIASLRAVASTHRQRVLELEQALALRDQLLASQDRLIEGQATHLRAIDTAYAG